MAKSKKSSKKGAKPAKDVKVERSKDDMDKAYYLGELAKAQKCMQEEIAYDAYTNKKLSLNEQLSYHAQIADTVRKCIDSRMFSEEEMKTIVKESGVEGLAEKAHKTLENHLYGEGSEIQKAVVPYFKKSVESSENQYLSNLVLKGVADELEISVDVSKISDEGLKNYAIVFAEKDKDSAEYKAALDKLIDDYVKDITKSQNTSDKQKKSSEWLWSKHYKEDSRTHGRIAALQYYAQNNEDKIKTLNSAYADNILTYKDSKKKLEAMVKYENSYAQALKNSKGQEE